MKTHKDKILPIPNVVDITCMDPSGPPGVAEKLSKTMRLMSFHIQNGVSCCKVMQDVQVMMKRGKNLGKSLNNVMVRHHEALTCRPRDGHMSFVSPMEYQFSCSGSPPRPSQAFSNGSNRKWSPAYHTRSQQHHALHYSHGSPGRRRRVIGLCRGDDTLDFVGPGLKQPPVERRAKITESSSMLSDAKDRIEEYRVDEAAEEFIERFYRELRLQKWLDHYR